jgi:O-antigen/teichoic acid export membrane protein
MTGRLTGRRLAWHSLLNLAGQGIPVFAALIAVPVLIRYMGTERFGILTLVWAIIGYFGLFDLGLGRALTQLVADRRHHADERELSSLVWKALLTMLGIGVLGSLLAEAIAWWLTHSVLTITPNLQGEATAAFRLMALVIPVIVVTSGLRGVLEAYQRFDLVNAARVPLGALNYLVPVAVMTYDTSLLSVVAVLAVVRVVGLVVHAMMCRRVMPGLGFGPDLRTRLPTKLLRMGGWMTISNVLSPVLVMADRFLIGALASAVVVAYYTAPFEIVTKLMIVASSVANSLFPAFAGRSDPHEQAGLYVRGVVMTSVGLFPILIVLLLFAPEILRLWLGPVFAERSSGVLQMLALGVYINCLAQIAFTLIQGAGRSDVTAMLHIAEIPFYLAAAWLLIRFRGVEGAALAWTLRVTIDAAAMFVVARRVAPMSSAPDHRRAWSLVALGVVLTVTAVACGSAPLLERAVLAVVSMMTVLGFAWFGVASVLERQRFRGLFAGGG